MSEAVTRRPIYISWSGLRSHEECRQQAYLRATKKRNPATDIRGYFHGTVVDAVMDCWLTNDPQPGEMPDMVDDLITECERKALETGDGVVRWKSHDDRDEMLKFGRELVAKLEPLLYKYVLPFDWEAHRRFKTSVTLPYLDGTPTTVNLVGESDLLVRGHPDFGRDCWCIYDLKGTKNNAYWRSTYGQLVFYDVAHGAEFGEYTKRVGFFQPMCDQQYLEFSVTDHERTELLTRVLRMASDQWAHDHLPKDDNKGCSRCDVNHACEKYQRVDVTGKMQLIGDEAFVGLDWADKLMSANG